MVQILFSWIWLAWTQGQIFEIQAIDLLYSVFESWKSFYYICFWNFIHCLIAFRCLPKFFCFVRLSVIIYCWLKMTYLTYLGVNHNFLVVKNFNLFLIFVEVLQDHRNIHVENYQTEKENWKVLRKFSCITSKFQFIFVSSLKLVKNNLNMQVFTGFSKPA